MDCRKFNCLWNTFISWYICIKYDVCGVKIP